MTGKTDVADAPKGQLEALREVLERWPLYRTLHFTGAKAFFLPPLIRLYCQNCGGFRNWTDPVPYEAAISRAPKPPTPVNSFRANAAEESGYGQKTYKCRDCGKSVVAYFYYRAWKQEGDSIFFKVGQHPPLESEPDNDLKRQFDKADVDLFKKALTSRNFNFGLGALAYLRRIVENKMNDLLDLIEQAAKLDGEVPEELARISDVKQSYRFKDKLEYAARVLPRHLRPNGNNPLDRLHDLASEGLHHKAEHECIEIFDQCRGAFEYLFKRLRVEIDDASEYIGSLKTTRRPDSKE